MARIEAVCFSSRGMLRLHNEDNYLFCGQYRKSDPENEVLKLYSEKLNRTETILGVFDGMGGMAHGEKASLIAAGCFAENFAGEGNELAENLSSKCKQANRLIQRSNLEMREESGTTAALIGFGSHSAVICNVGDSRVYSKFRDSFEQLSKDHTDRALIDAMKITSRRPRVMQYLGMQEQLDVYPSITTVKMHRNQIFLCCTDGLYAMVPDSEINRILSIRGSLEVLAGKLMDEALKAGGKDNITFILCKVKIGFWR